LSDSLSGVLIVCGMVNVPKAEPWPSESHVAIPSSSSRVRPERIVAEQVGQVQRQVQVLTPDKVTDPSGLLWAFTQPSFAGEG
jgi:hypothetical protein